METVVRVGDEIQLVISTVISVCNLSRGSVLYILGILFEFHRRWTFFPWGIHIFIFSCSECVASTLR